MITRPLKHVADVWFSNVDKKSVDGQVPVRLCNYTDVYYNDHIVADTPFMDATATPDQVSRFSLRAGDVLITKDSETANDIGVTALVAEDLPGVLCGYHLAIARPRVGAVDGRFLRWALTATPSQSQLEVAATGVTRFGLRQDTVAGMLVPTPGFAEQRVIADYLDAETGRIDALVATRRHSVDLAREKFESRVWWATTKGVAPAPLRDSGVAWVGGIPAHWGTPAVGHVFEVQLGKMLNPEATTSGEMFPYLRNENVQWDRIDLDDLNLMHFDVADRSRFALQLGDLLVCEGGEVGRAAMWRGAMSACYYQKALHRVRARRPANTRFLMYVLRAAAGRGVFANEGNSTTIVHLTAEKLRAHRFPCPPTEEQDLIVEELDRAAATLSVVESAIDRQIGLLGERRQALITAATTGQPEIPGLAA